jgi:ubiquinone/menaquinone biosynthesis C-methylase UbiE
MAFHEFTNKDKMAEEITRMLKPHGMLLLVEREPLYEGHTDKYCKNKYVSVSTVRNTFKHLRLVDTTKMMYPGGAVSVMRFTR